MSDTTRLSLQEQELARRAFYDALKHCTEFDALDAAIETVLRHRSTSPDMRDAAQNVVAYWDSLWEVPTDDERPTEQFRDVFDAKIEALRNALEAK